MTPIRLALTRKRTLVKGQAGEGACNSRDPERPSLADADDSEWSTVEVSL